MTTLYSFRHSPLSAGVRRREAREAPRARADDRLHRGPEPDERRADAADPGRDGARAANRQLPDFRRGVEPQHGRLPPTRGCAETSSRNERLKLCTLPITEWGIFIPSLLTINLNIQLIQVYSYG